MTWFSAIAVILRHGRENHRTLCNFSIWIVAGVRKPCCGKVKFDIYWNLQRHRAVLPAIVRLLLHMRLTYIIKHTVTNCCYCCYNFGVNNDIIRYSVGLLHVREHNGVMQKSLAFSSNSSQEQWRKVVMWRASRKNHRLPRVAICFFCRMSLCKSTKHS